MRRSLLPLCLLALPLAAQPPVAPPPAFLPSSVTGKPHEPVTPVAAVTPKAVPLDRFKTPGHPVETVAAVESAKEATGWLTRMSQADGRFKAGIDATLLREIPGNDYAQASAALAVARAARFTGDEKATAAASQACLALLTLAKPDLADATVRVPGLAADRGNKVGFAAVLAMAIYDSPTPDAKLVAEADKLCKFLYTRLRSDGSVKWADDDKGEPDGVNVYPGLCFQALLASDRATPEAWKGEAVERGVKFYREQFKTGPTPDLCGSLLPAVCEFAVRTKNKDATAFAFEMADWLCDRQLTTTDARNLRWVGAYKPATGDEPPARTAAAAEGMCAAVALAAQVPDATRFARYRKSGRDALTFCRGLQFSDGNRNALHFTAEVRTQWLLGGVHGSPSDGLLRVEHTAGLLNAQLRYLESGAEKAD